MKIRHTHAHRANQTIILPIVGRVSLDKNCEVEVPDEVGKIVVQDGIWVDTAAKINDKVKAHKEAAPSEKIATSAADQDQKAEMITLVKEMSHSELLELALASKVKGATLFKKPENVETLRNLVIKNIEKS